MESQLTALTPGVLNLLEQQAPWSPLQPAGLASPDLALLAQGDVQLMATSAAETTTLDSVGATTATTYSIAAGDSVTGYVAGNTDSDWYKVSLTAGVKYTFALNRIDASGLDCYLRLLNSAATQITFNDDSNGTLNSQIIYTAPASGTFYLAASSYAGATNGQYSLSVSTPTAGYNTSTGYGEASAERAIEKLLGITIADVPNQFSGGLYGIDRLGAPESWSAGYTGSGIVVAVVDTGVDRNHADLSSNIWEKPGEIAGNGKDDDGNGYIDDVYGWNFSSFATGPNGTITNPGNNNTLDDNKHGTHVAGTIAAARNTIGVTGVAYGAKIMPVKVLDANGSGSFDNVARGIRYAVDNGADVINLSLAGSGSSTLQSAVQYAWNNQVAVIMAAGNNGFTSPTHPAAYATTTGMAIGAVDSTGALASFSNKAGSTVLDYVTAAGVNVYSTFPGNLYGTLSGTSMATPGVAGAMALLMQANKKLATPLTLDKLEALFTSTASNMLTGTAGTTTVSSSTTTNTSSTSTRTASIMVSASVSRTTPTASNTTNRRGASLNPLDASEASGSPQDRTPAWTGQNGAATASQPEAETLRASSSSTPSVSSSSAILNPPLPLPAAEASGSQRSGLEPWSSLAEAGSVGSDADALTGFLKWPWPVGR